MSQSKSTPRPWRAEGQYPSHPELGPKRYIVDVATGMEVASCQHRVQGIGAKSEAEANAATIVKCVNLHDELLFSLEYCYRKLNELVKSGKISEPLLLDEVPDLLKRAKGAQ